MVFTPYSHTSHEVSTVTPRKWVVEMLILKGICQTCFSSFILRRNSVLPRWNIWKLTALPCYFLSAAVVAQMVPFHLHDSPSTGRVSSCLHHPHNSSKIIRRRTHCLRVKLETLRKLHFSVLGRYLDVGFLPWKKQIVLPDHDFYLSWPNKQSSCIIPETVPGL